MILIHFLEVRLKFPVYIRSSGAQLQNQRRVEQRGGLEYFFFPLDCASSIV